MSPRFLPASQCVICFAPHNYTTNCHSSHSTFLCLLCWAEHVKNELSLFPYLGCRCPYCRGVIDNDVVRALLPQQKQLQDAKQRDDQDAQLQASAALANSNPEVGPSREFHQMDSVRVPNLRMPGRPRRQLGGGETEQQSRQATMRPVTPFGSRRERAARREEREKRLNEESERLEKSRRESEECFARTWAEAESRPVDENLYHPYY